MGEPKGIRSVLDDPEQLTETAKSSSRENGEIDIAVKALITRGLAGFI